MSPNLVFVTGYVVCIRDEDTERLFSNVIRGEREQAEAEALAARTEGWDAEVLMLIDPDAIPRYKS